MARTYKLSFFRILRSEWIKLFSLRSTWWILVVAILVNVGICLLVAVGTQWTEANAGDIIGPGGVQPGMFGLLSSMVVEACGLAGQILFVILAILMITNEYSSGMIRSTLTVAPRRRRVFLAKMFIVVIVGILIFGISVAGGWASSYAILQNSVGVDLVLTSETSVRILGGFVAEMILIGLLSFGLGALIRSTAGSIGAALGVVLVLPLIVTLLINTFITDTEPTGWRLWLINASAFLPTNAGGLVTEVSVPESSLLGPWEGLGVLGAWTFLSLVIGVIATARKDV